MKLSKLKSYVFVGLLGMGMLAAAADARAAVITGIGTTVTNTATGSLGPVGGVPVAPNNDNGAGPSANVVPSNHFLFNTLPLDFEFTLANSGGTTEYQFTPSFLNINFTGLTWTQFSFELGFGTGTGFTRSGAGDGLDFDTPDGNSAAFSPMFPSVVHKEDSLFFSGASIGSIGAAAFVFAVDLPDNLQKFNPYELNRFTLRVTPNGAPVPDPTPVPEPGTMMLIGTGIAALVAKNRKRLA